jgi:rubrerythrin
MTGAVPKSERDILFLAIAQEKAAYSHLAAAARACTCPKAKRLYNQLALDEIKHLLTLVSVMDGVADDCLADLDLTFPVGTPPDPLPRTEEGILGTAMAEERRSRQLFENLARNVDREELSRILEMLRTEEEDHLVRLQSLLYGFEADRPVVAKWLRSIRRLVPTASPQR